MKAEAEKYLEQADRLLDEYSKANQPTLNTPHTLKVARESVEYYSSLLRWCQEFKNSTKNLKEEVISWRSEFAEQWQTFLDTVKSGFSQAFPENRVKFNSEADLGQLTNKIIKLALSR